MINGGLIYLNTERLLPIRKRFLSVGLIPRFTGIARLQHKESLQFAMVDGREDTLSRQSIEGMGVQVYTRGGQSALVSADEVNESTLEGCIQQAIALCKDDGESRILHASGLWSTQPDQGERTISTEYDIESMSPETARQALLEIHQELKQISPDTPCRTSFLISEDEWRILRTDGTDVHFTVPRSLFRHEISCWQDGKNTTLSITWVGHDYSTIIYRDIREKLFHRSFALNGHLQHLMTAQPVDHGSYPLIIDAHLMGGLVHEAFGHAAEGDLVFKGSILSRDNKLNTGQRMGPETISIVDGPVDLDWGDQPFSANGFLRQTVRIVNQGLLCNALTDIFIAEPIGAFPTGAERVEDYRKPPIPRMSNIRLEMPIELPLVADLEDISARELYDLLLLHNIAEPSKKYLFLSGYRGGQVNSTSGDFVFQCAMIFVFWNGQVHLHPPAIFSGNIMAILNAIQMGFGRQHIRRSGMCGKRGQKVPTSGGGPFFTLIGQDPTIRIGGR